MLADCKSARTGGIAEHLVNMVARAANLTCQPACAALVGFELLTDEVPDVDVAIAFHWERIEYS